MLRAPAPAFCLAPAGPQLILRPVRPIPIALLLLAGAASASGADSRATAAVVAVPATNRYEWRSEHSRDGIGKFYFGREIAHVMGHQAADWLERPERDAEEHSEKLVDQLRIRPGDIVADIGAGTGYFSRRLAGKTGPHGMVLAVDIQTEMLDLLRTNMSAAGITNVKPILGTTIDPKLPANGVDLALMVDVYHEFDFPYEMMKSITGALKPGGRVVFVEFRGEDPAVPIKLLHKMTEAQVRKEMSGFPLQWVETLSPLPRQHILVFRKLPQGP